MIEIVILNILIFINENARDSPPVRFSGRLRQRAASMSPAIGPTEYMLVRAPTNNAR